METQEYIVNGAVFFVCGLEQTMPRNKDDGKSLVGSKQSKETCPYEQRLRKDCDIRIFTSFLMNTKAQLRPLSTFNYEKKKKELCVHCGRPSITMPAKLVHVTMFAFYQDRAGLTFQFNPSVPLQEPPFRAHFIRFQENYDTNSERERRKKKL